MAKFELTEISNPKKTIERRLEAAEGETASQDAAESPKVERAERTMTQSEFTGGGPLIRAASAKKNAKMIELMRRHQAP
jgi:hypothetical protein